MSNEREEVDSEIDGIKFIAQHMEPLDLYPMVPRMIKIVGPVLQQVGGVDLESIKKLLKSDTNKLGQIFMAIGSALGEKENANLPLELLRRVRFELPGDDGEMETFSLTTAKEINRAFRGRFVTMLKAMWFSFTVQFSDFFDGGSGESPSKESETEKANPSD